MLSVVLICTVMYVLCTRVKTPKSEHGVQLNSLLFAGQLDAVPVAYLALTVFIITHSNHRAVRF